MKATMNTEKSIDIKDLKLGNWWRGAQEDI